jgi:16S rRNA (guanine966-N2)-methyltransferase
MRIIGGVFKGRKLFLPNDKNTRPLKDLVKESIFNLILHSNKINIDIEKSLVLDLFSGSGSFGLECLSREAKKVFFFRKLF